jgi:hypothetical protein
MTWAAIGSTAISAGASLAAGTPDAGPGFAVVNKPQFSFSEPALEASSNFLTSNLEQIGQGNFPQFFQNLIPSLRAELEDPLRRRTFGRQGRRSDSTLGLAQAQDALSGLGPQQVGREGSATSRGLTDFQERSQSIDRFIAQQGADITSKFALAIPELLNTAPKGPDSEVVNLSLGGAGGGGGGGALGGLASAFGSFVGAGGADSAISGIGNFFGGAKGVAGNTITAANSRLLDTSTLGQNFGRAPTAFQSSGLGISGSQGSSGGSRLFSQFGV